MRLSVIIAALAVGGYVFSRLATLGETGGGGSAVSAEEVMHLHGIGLNPADGRVYLATHAGVLRIGRDGRAVRLADRYQDTMGFTVAGPDRFFGSGHPDLREGLPARLGLIRSDDAAQTWTSISLSGQADLHAVVVVGAWIYAADATSQQLIRSDDEGRTWEKVSKVDLGALAVSPDRRRLVGASSDGTPLRSDDGGRSWSVVDGPALAALTWDPELGPIGAAPEGTVYASEDGSSWSAVGELPGQNPVLTAVAGQLIAGTDGAVISRSSDGGRTWTTDP